ncbi:MAG TPA: hypothetical protein VHW00_15245 [Thermoanaerobaculia bacterium]|nr:hypothetical protein [Thermoanaerobaculia bacterium]
MIRAPLSTTSVLDESAEVVSMTGPGWVGLVILATLPLRYLQAIFLDQLLEVGGNATHYGNLLGATANLIVLAILIATWGRAIYARACRLSLSRNGAPGRGAWRVPAPALASYVLTSAAAAVLGYISIFTCIFTIGAVIFAGLAVGTMELNERVSLTNPFKLIIRYLSHMRIQVALVFVFLCGVGVALANLGGAFAIGNWAAGALGGFDAPQWQTLFGNNRRYVLMLFAGALATVEPFWIAAQVVYVRKAGAEESGDDLRSWFEEFRRSEA